MRLWSNLQNTMALLQLGGDFSTPSRGASDRFCQCDCNCGISVITQWCRAFWFGKNNYSINFWELSRNQRWGFNAMQWPHCIAELTWQFRVDAQVKYTRIFNYLCKADFHKFKAYCTKLCDLEFIEFGSYATYIP